MTEPAVRSPHLLVAAFPGGVSFLPSYPAIKLVTQLDFREMCTVESIMGTLVSPDKLHDDVSDTVSQDTAGSRM